MGYAIGYPMVKLQHEETQGYRMNMGSPMGYPAVHYTGCPMGHPTEGTVDYPMGHRGAPMAYSGHVPWSTLWRTLYHGMPHAHYCS